MNKSSNLIIQNKKTERRINKLKQNDFSFFILFFISFPKSSPVACRYNISLNGGWLVPTYALILLLCVTTSS